MKQEVQTQQMKLQLVLFFGGWLFATAGVRAQLNSTENEVVIVVQLQADPPLDAVQALLPSSEISRVVLPLEEGSLLAHSSITEAGEFQEVIGSAGCFFPNMKLVYSDVTYVVSTYCTDARKYMNDGPYLSGTREMPVDLVFTEELLNYLGKVQLEHFKPDFTQLYRQLAPYYVAPVPTALPDSVWLVPEFEQYLNQDLQDLSESGVDPTAEQELDADADQTIDYNYYPMGSPPDEELEKFENSEDELADDKPQAAPKKVRKAKRKSKAAGLE